jgi:hypothetical protein
MAIPSVVLDALNSLNIADLPPQVNAGDLIDLGLSPGLNVFDVLSQPPKLFDIELNDITLDNLAIDLTDISLAPAGSSGKLQLTLDADNPSGSAPGAADLKAVSKAVEFNPLNPPTDTTAANIETSEASLHALSHAIPNPTILNSYSPIPSTDVEGLLSRITGTVTQVEKFSGGITGDIGGHIKGIITGTIRNLRGSVTAPKLLTAAPEIQVVWHIEDRNGKRLTEGTDFVIEGETGLTDPAASLKFLPVFTEPSNKVELFVTRRIFCQVTVTADGASTNRLLGPVEVLLKRIPFPTVLVMTEHAIDVENADPGAILVAVPRGSSVMPEQVAENLGAIKEILEQFSQLTNFKDTIDQIVRIIGFMSPTTNRVRTNCKTSGEKDLWWVEREPGFLLIGRKSWEDCISGLIMIGPPGRAARFYNAKNYWERLGAFEIVLGATAVAFINNLTGSNPECQPAEAFTQRWIPPPSDFNDVLSSFQFRPLVEEVGISFG